MKKYIFINICILFIISQLGISAQEAQTVKNPYPVIVKTIPQSGALDVDPNLDKITVIFSQDMNTKSMSWVYESKDLFPELDGPPKYTDNRTCVAKVKLQPDKTYWIWLNSDKFRSFINKNKKPALPYLLVFKTKK